MAAWLKDAEYDRSGRMVDSTVVAEFDPMDMWTIVEAAVKDVHGPDKSKWVRLVNVRVQMEHDPERGGFRPKSARAYITVGKELG